MTVLMAVAVAMTVFLAVWSGNQQVCFGGVQAHIEVFVFLPGSLSFFIEQVESTIVKNTKMVLGGQVGLIMLVFDNTLKLSYMISCDVAHPLSSASSRQPRLPWISMARPT